MYNSFNCPCQSVIPNERDYILKQFTQIREYCPALKKILIPDIIWEDFKRIAQADLDNARHKSILLLAFERGYLKNITSPLHTYLIEGDKPKESLKKQYVNDLTEKWMFAKNELERHHKSRIYLGKLTELLCAEWLEKQRWKITHLEALGANTDIEAISSDNIPYSIEVKYIGRLDDEFLSTINSLSGRGGSFDQSLYATSDFILFKAYTAAKQLATNANNHIACLVISCITWPYVDRLFEKNWMKWKTPKFFNNDPEWQNFIQEKKRTYPEIDKDLHLTINSLDRLYILKDDNFNYSLKYAIDFN